MSTMTIEKLEEVLCSKGVDNLKRYSSNNELFSRWFSFSVNENSYKICWYHNLITLYLNSDCLLIFNYVIYSGTWPNEYKWNLQFYIEESKCPVFIIPIEKWK